MQLNLLVSHTNQHISEPRQQSCRRGKLPSALDTEMYIKIVRGA